MYYNHKTDTMEVSYELYNALEKYLYARDHAKNLDGNTFMYPKVFWNHDKQKFDYK